MAIEDTINTNQHYVSQMLLRGFETAAGSEQVHVFDKKTGKKFVTAVRNIAAERGFYDLGDAVTLDAGMNRADSAAAPIINKIRDRQSLAAAAPEDREILAGFVVLQLLRTRGFQAGFLNIGQAMIQAIKKRESKVPLEWNEHLIPERQRELYLHVIPRFLRKFLPYLLTKDVLLLQTKSVAPFCTSDNPVTLNNTLNDDTLGLGVLGTQVYLPISTELTLAYICPSVGMAYQQHNLNLERRGGFVSEDAFCYLQARDVGKGLMLTADNVRFQNSLQIRNAERFVVSSRDDFEDAIDMVTKDPDTRVGPRATFS